MAEFQGHLFPRNLGVTIGGGGGGVTSINGDATPAQTFTVGTAGSDFNIADGGGGSHVWNLPTASAVNRGALISADWTTFNNKQAGSASLTALAALVGTGYITQTGANTFAERTLIGTANQVIITNGNGVAGNTTFATPQDIATASSPTFVTMTLTGNLDVAQAFIQRAVAPLTVSAATTGKIYFDNVVNKFLVSENTGAYVNLLGSPAGNAPVDATYVTLTANATLTNERVLTGTANQVVITDNGANSTVVLSLPQDIALTSNVTFNNAILNGTLKTNIINSLDAINSRLTLQAQTFTATASENAVQITPIWTDNFNHTGLLLTPTQNNGIPGQFTGLVLAMQQAGAGVVSAMIGFQLNNPSVAGTVTTSTGIYINDQTNANITSSTAIRLVGTGLPNSVVFGNSTSVFCNAVNNLRILESSTTGGLDFNLTTTSATINTVTQNNASIILQNQTFTPGGTHNAVLISPTWVSEGQAHNGLNISPMQNGANANGMRGIDITMTKATAATTVSQMDGIRLETPVITGTVLRSNAITIVDQTNANVTNPRAININGLGIANALVFGGSGGNNGGIIYGNTANNIRFTNSTNGSGLDFNLTNAGVQTITTITGDMNLIANSGIVAIITSREEWALGASVTAANNLTLGTDGNSFTITGNTQINALTVANWQAGSLLILKFTGTPTVKHNTAGGAGTAPIFLAGSVDLTAANNTILGLVYDGTQWQESFRKAA